MRNLDTCSVMDVCDWSFPKINGLEYASEVPLEKMIYPVTWVEGGVHGAHVVAV